MNYQYDLILRQEYGNKYALTTLDGRRLFEVRSSNRVQAMIEAQAYMSSWTSVRIRFEDEYEQDQERDRMLKQAASADVTAGQHPDVPEAGTTAGRPTDSNGENIS